MYDNPTYEYMIDAFKPDSPNFVAKVGLERPSNAWLASSTIFLQDRYPKLVLLLNPVTDRVDNTLDVQRGEPRSR